MENRLVRLVYVVEKYGPTTVYGRIVQFDEQGQNLLLYNDDRKEVISIRFSEIDNIEPSSEVANM